MKKTNYNSAKEDKRLLLSFIERNLPSMAKDFDEGIGIGSERYFVEKIIQKILKRDKIKSVLEAPADGLMGIPGMNSVYFARAGADVTLGSPSKALLDNAKIFWQKLGLEDKFSSQVCAEDFSFAKDNSYDLIWNYCTFEHFDPELLLSEMKRVSKKYVVIFTQNIWNWGYPIHRRYHKKHGMEWDHGYTHLMKMGSLKKAFKEQGIKIVMKGTVDAPPWLDTFDMHTRGLGKKMFNKNAAADEKVDAWYWSSLQKGDLETLSKNKYIKILRAFEKCCIFPLNYVFAHHFYLVGEVDERAKK